MDESWLLELQAELLAIYADIEEMKAENQAREHLGQPIAYTGEAFHLKSNEAIGIRDCIIKYR